MVSQSIGVIRRVSNMVPDDVLHTLYYALIYSRITYVIYAWGSAYPTTLKRLKSLVKKTNINAEYFPEQTWSLFSSIWLGLKKNILCKMLKAIWDGKHLQFVNKLDQHSNAHNYETWSSVGNCFTTPFYSKVNVKTRLFTVHQIME